MQTNLRNRYVNFILFFNLLDHLNDLTYTILQIAVHRSFSINSYKSFKLIFCTYLFSCQYINNINNLL